MKNYKNMDLMQLLKERERVQKELEAVQDPDYIKSRTAAIYGGKLDSIVTPTHAHGENHNRPRRPARAFINSERKPEHERL